MTVENKIPPHRKYITTPKFNTLTAGRLAQPNLASKSGISNFEKKTNFDDSVKKLKGNVTSNKTKMYFLKRN